MLGCCNKIPSTGCRINNRSVFLTVLEAEESKSMAPTDLVFGEVHSLDGCLFDVMSHGRRVRESLEGPFCKGATPTMKGPPLLSKHLLKAHFQMSSYWVLRFNLWILGGHRYSVCRTTICRPRLPQSVCCKFHFFWWKSRQHSKSGWISPHTPLLKATKNENSLS